MVEDFAARGWVRFAFDRALAAWAAHARRDARRAARDPDLAQWHVCAGTWFIGVGALGNDARGRVGGSGPLTGPAVDFIASRIAPIPRLHRAQVSAVYPGYPRPREGESCAAFRYRVRRDGAHLDGLKRCSRGRGRRIAEPHAFILGLPLTRADPGAAPLVVWEASHVIMGRALRGALNGCDPAEWGRVDLSEAYQNARRDVFETCARVPLHAVPGEAVVLHRHTLHGIAPWADGARAPPDGRVIVYFRPPMPGGAAGWLTAP
ncbi:MAG: hypothetical protein KDK02_10285 [Rhodobacteraceae bacterium]|nr:hypothetical protein [Paracoccaceae bacterium]